MSKRERFLEDLGWFVYPAMLLSNHAPAPCAIAIGKGSWWQGLQP